MRMSALMVALLLAPAAVGAADGKEVMECIKQVRKTVTWGNSEYKEIVAAVACKGASVPIEEPVPPPSLRYIGVKRAPGETKRELQLEEKARLVADCMEEVTFAVKATGQEAQRIAATACVGAMDAEETALCIVEVSKAMRFARDLNAEAIAAEACARGNPAYETAACVSYVSFRLDIGGEAGDALASVACGR